MDQFRLRQHHAEKHGSSYLKADNATKQLGGLIAVVCVIFVSGGATCNKFRRGDDLFRPPVVFDSAPESQQLIAAINRSLSIERIQSLNIKVTSPDIATSLRGTFTWERPLNFRFSASPGSMVFGEAIAAGSNNQTFWLKTKYPPPTQVVYANYQEFEGQAGPRHILPVSPIWIREALGVVEIDPADDTQMSARRPDGKVELTTVIRSGNRLYSRTLVVEPTYVVISEVILKDAATKRLIAQASLSEHSNYSAHGVNLPGRVDIQLHPDTGPTLAFTIEVGQYSINDGPPSDPASFAIPDTTGVTVHDLVKLNSAMAAGGSSMGLGRPTLGPGPSQVFHSATSNNIHFANAPLGGLAYQGAPTPPGSSNDINMPDLGLPATTQPKYTPSGLGRRNPILPRQR